MTLSETMAVAKKPRITASWAALLLTLLVQCASVWTAVVWHSSRTETAIETNRVALIKQDSTFTVVLNGIVTRLDKMQGTDSTLNERQLINSIGLGAVVTALRAHGIQVYIGLPRP